MTEEQRIMPDLEEEPVMSVVRDVEKVLSDISFEPSCVDMDWKWEVQGIYERGAVMMGERHVGVADHGDGFLIRTSFKRPDRNTGEVGRGWGAWHHIPHDATRSAVVKRAYVAAKAILEHELMESFKYKGGRPFDPHNTIPELLHIQGGRYIASIP